MLEQVRLARPSKLLVVADGPRADRPGDKERCEQTREVIRAGVDWEADVQTNYAQTNVGLRTRVSSGITWAFTQVDRAIILEDDCVAHLDFFRYCAELLEYYKDDSRVGVVTGDNFQPPGFSRPSSYFFSKYPHCWGWATWKRAWKCYDGEMSQWPQLKQDGWLRGLFHDPLHARYWEDIFDRVCAREINSWAYPWTFSCWSQSLLTAAPCVNLVSNIGTGADATHTEDECGAMHRPVFPMAMPLVHPKTVVLDYRADDYSQKNIFGAAPSPRTLKAKLRRKALAWLGD